MVFLILFVITQPKIVVSPDVYDLGKIGWETVSYNFSVSNIGNDTLIIKSVSTSCGCTRASVNKKILQPGDSTKLIVTFSPASHKIKGRAVRKITIRSNDPDEPKKSVLIKATVQPPPDLKTKGIDFYELPEFAFRSANILRAYEFVVQNSDYVANFLCYCGCDIASEHKSLKDCFIGQESYADHASNCTVCVKEVLDIIKMQKEGRNIAEIENILEKNYKSFHPGNKSSGK